MHLDLPRETRATLLDSAGVILNRKILLTFWKVQGDGILNDRESLAYVDYVPSLPI